MSSLGVAVAQFAPGADRAQNLEAIRELTGIAADRGAHLVVFPEYSSYFTAQMDDGWVRSAEALDGEFAAGVAAIARDRGVHLVAGMLERHTATHFYNTLVAFGPEGRLVAHYRKLHVYDAFGQRESDFATPGEIAAPETFAVGALTVGLQTCYDLRFPEVTRRLVDAGADLVVLPAEWVRGPLKEHHWRTLATARAIENTVYVAAAGHTPPVGVGNSMVLDPMGVELAGLGEAADVAVAWATPERIAEVRAKNPALQLRRFTVVPR